MAGLNSILNQSVSHPVTASARRVRRRSIGVALLLLLAIASASCRSVFSRKYEYDEDIHVALDGSATIYISASIAALVALRGVDLDVDPQARFDRAKVRALFESQVAQVASVTASRRDNRRYVHLRLEVPDIRRLDQAAPFAWSRYALARENDRLVYRQTVGAAAGRDVGNVGWSGDEIVAVRLHLPSRVPFHNSPSGVIERGNIIVWEQPLAERLKGTPLAIEAHMETETIFVRTLTLFGITVVLAAATFAFVIWWVRRRGDNTGLDPRQASPPNAA
jgi:hypothetical protein